MAKPRLFTNNAPNPSEGAGDGADEAAEEGEEKGTGGERGEGKERASHNTPPRRATCRQREDHLAREGREDSSEEP